MSANAYRLGWLLAVAASGVLAEEPATRYAVVCEDTYSNERTFSVMTEEEYRDAAKRALGERSLLRNALSAARREWREAEYERVGRRMSSLNQVNNGDNQAGREPVWRVGATDYENRVKPFPSLRLNMSPAFRCLGFHNNKADADKKCAEFAERASRGPALSRGSTRLEGVSSRLDKPARASAKPSDHEADTEKAMKLFEEHLARVRAADELPGGLGSQSNRRLGEGITSLGVSGSGFGSGGSAKSIERSTSWGLE